MAKSKQMQQCDRMTNAVAWFVELACAKRDNDFKTAAKAQCELEALGVSVRIHRDTSPAGQSKS